MSIKSLSSNAIKFVVDSHIFFFSSRRRHTRFKCDWSSDVCSSDLLATRLATLPLLGMIIVIQIFVYPVEAWVDDLLWGGCLLFIASRGAGAFSLDFLIENLIETGRVWRRGEAVATGHDGLPAQ